MTTLTCDSIDSDSVFNAYAFDLGDACTTDLNTATYCIISDSSTNTVEQASKARGSR